MIYLTDDELKIVAYALASRQSDIERNSTEYETLEKLILYFESKISKQGKEK